jgi:CIC family chloride channel protein
MAGMLGSVTGAVMTTVFIMLDLTASYQLFLPVLLTVIPANWLRKQGCPQSIYTLKLARRGILFPDCQVRKISP